MKRWLPRRIALQAKTGSEFTGTSESCTYMVDEGGEVTGMYISTTTDQIIRMPVNSSHGRNAKMNNCTWSEHDFKNLEKLSQNSHLVPHLFFFTCTPWPSFSLDIYWTIASSLSNPLLDLMIFNSHLLLNN